MGVDLQRRAFFTAKQAKEINSDVHLPWLQSTGHFLDNCSQCQACIKHCPESIIVPGQGGYPTVNFNLGECTYCQACTSHCPEDLFDLDQSTAWSLRLTIKDSCLTERGVVCQSCRDACEPRAITFKYMPASIPKPLINELLCTRCGACVSSCPVNALLPSEEASFEKADKVYTNE